MRGDGSRRMIEFECPESDSNDGKFDASDFDKYFLCMNSACRRKISFLCMHDLVRSAKMAYGNIKNGEELPSIEDDGEERLPVWRRLRLGPPVIGETMQPPHDDARAT